MSRTRDISNIYNSDDFSGAGNIVSISNNYTAVEDDVIFVNTASTSITVTLPSSPSSGGKIKVLDVAANSQNNNITILGNTYSINGASAYIIDTPDSSVDLVYINSNKGWIVSNEYISITKPSAPTGVSAVDVGTGRAFNNGAATISFIPSTSGDPATSYTVVSTPGSYSATGVSSPIVVTGLQSNTSYTFTVSATNAAGTSSSSTASDSITATTVPEAPTLNSVTYGFEKLTASFTTNANGGKSITSFTTTPLGSSPVIGSSPVTLPSLTGGTSYSVTTTATNQNGTSLPSNSISSTPFTASGGTISTYSNYRVHSFDSGTSTFTLTGNNITTDYLIVAGGGSGGASGDGNQGGGGGGGGGVIVSAGQSLSPNSYSVVVGAGGAGVTGGSAIRGNTGNNSSFNGQIAIGGGFGGRGVSGQVGAGNGGTGGSGGGAGVSQNAPSNTGGSGTAGQGNNGGNSGTGASSGMGSGGGGGAGAVGGNGTSSAGGSGGSGIQNNYQTGTNQPYGGGGGGPDGNGQGSHGSGGLGGGTAGSTGNTSNGTANTGGGSGGANSTGGSVTSGAGGSGTIIVRYAI
jgi:hypothetical protein